MRILTIKTIVLLFCLILSADCLASVFTISICKSKNGIDYEVKKKKYSLTELREFLKKIHDSYGEDISIFIDLDAKEIKTNDIIDLLQTFKKLKFSKAILVFNYEEGCTRESRCMKIPINLQDIEIEKVFQELPAPPEPIQH